MEKLERNFIWMAAANITGSIFNAAVFIYLARVLKSESFGHLSYATSFVFYMLNFVDLGLSTLGIREIAKDRSRVSEYVSNIVSFRLAAASAIFIIFSAAMLFSSHSQLLKVLLIEASLMLFVSAMATEWAFQGIEHMKMIFISFMTTGYIQLLMTLIFVKGPQDLLRFPVISFLSALPIITIYLKKLSFKPELLKPDLKRIKSYLSSSLVLWSISLLVQIYNGVDIIIMGVFRPPAEVGCYAIARRAVGGIGLLMVFFAGATLPRLSATFAKDAMEFDQATRKFLRLSVALIIAVVLPLAFFARDIIHFTVGGEYLSAVHPFLILLCGLAIVMFNLPFSTGLIAAGLERDVLKQAFASASVNLISNFILIEKYGMIGASFSFVMAELVALVWILTVYRKRIGSKVILDV